MRSPEIADHAADERLAPTFFPPTEDDLKPAPVERAVESAEEDSDAEAESTKTALGL